MPTSLDIPWSSCTHTQKEKEKEKILERLYNDNTQANDVKKNIITLRPEAETLFCEELGGKKACLRDPLAVEGDGGSSAGLVGKETACARINK